MSRRTSTEFDPRISAIAGHLRAIEKELGGIGKNASRQASARALATGNQIADAIWPILNDLVDRFGRGRRAAVDEAASLGNEAARSGPGSAMMLWVGLQLGPKTALLAQSRSLLA
jgi:hypothetical protein